MTDLLGTPKSIEMPSRNKDYPGKSLLINTTVQDAVFDGQPTAINERIDECVQEVLGQVATKWKQYALVGIIFIKSDGSRKSFIDIEGRSITRDTSARQFTFKVVARG